MNAGGVFFLGLRYLARHRVKTILLVSAFVLAMGLPVSISRVVGHVEAQLRSRAEQTGLVLGAAGSALELTFNALYFTKPGIASLPYSEVEEIHDTGLGQAIPLYVRYAAGDYRIVGTNLDYLDFRKFQFAEGRSLLRLGECVIGARVARENGIQIGDSVISSPESLFDLAGVYPLKMKVVGILESTGTPDDRGIFVDLRTAWIIEGLGHGHEEASELSDDQILERKGDTVRLNASIVEYYEITEENLNSFHFHEEEGKLPLTAILVLPYDEKSQAIFKGRYANKDTRILVTPADEMEELFDTVFQVQRVVLSLLIAVGVAAAALGLIVFLLSNRLRAAEFRHLKNLGASPATMKALIGFEAGFVLLCSGLLTIAVLVLVDWIVPIVLIRLI